MPDQLGKGDALGLHRGKIVSAAEREARPADAAGKLKQFRLLRLEQQRNAVPTAVAVLRVMLDANGRHLDVFRQSPRTGAIRSSRP